jgi:hypothetical protein
VYSILDAVAADFSCGTFVLIGLGYNLIWRSVVRGGLLKAEVTASRRRPPSEGAPR